MQLGDFSALLTSVQKTLNACLTLLVAATTAAFITTLGLSNISVSISHASHTATTCPFRLILLILDFRPVLNIVNFL